MSLGAPINIPCFAWPFRITDQGPAVVEHDSDEEVMGCVQAVVACPIGACPELPTFGIPDPTFQPAPPNATGVITAVQQWEPRATETAVVSAIDQTGGSWSIQLDSSIADTGQ